MNLNAPQKEALVAEISVMKALKHQNIVSYFGSYYKGKTIWVRCHIKMAPHLRLGGHGAYGWRRLDLNLEPLPRNRDD